MEIKVIIVGHIAFNKDITISGTRVSIGGAAFYSAVGASLGGGNNSGIVALVGEDFDLNKLSNLSIDLTGIQTIKDKKTARFTVTQLENNSRTFSANWGVANDVESNVYPIKYSSAPFVHLSTAPPQQQLEWIKIIREVNPKTLISVDTFEQFAIDYPDESLMAMKEADFIFINKEEASILDFKNSPLFSKPHILKLGADGAIYRDKKSYFHIKAPVVKVIDTTGAGDVLAGVFLSQIAKGETKKAALKTAVKLASNSIRRFGVNHLFTSTKIKKIEHEKN